MNRTSGGKRRTDWRGAREPLRRSGRRRLSGRGESGYLLDDRNCGLFFYRGRGGARRSLAFFRLVRLDFRRTLGFFLRRIVVVVGADAVLVFGNVLAKQAAQFQNHVVLKRAGMRLLVVDAQFGEPVQ
jgi:hypothetical protein